MICKQVRERKRSRKRLTRLVVCGLLLGGSILYAPVAEADDAGSGNKIHGRKL